MPARMPWLVAVDRSQHVGTHASLARPSVARFPTHYAGRVMAGDFGALWVMLPGSRPGRESWELIRP